MINIWNLFEQVKFEESDFVEHFEKNEEEAVMDPFCT